MPKTEVAAIVASGSFLSQSLAASASNTYTLFTPSANGIFRVTSAPNAATPGTIASNTVSWISQGVQINEGVGEFNPGAITFFAPGGQAIQVQITAVPQSITYDLYWFIEQLG